MMGVATGRGPRLALVPPRQGLTDLTQLASMSQAALHSSRLPWPVLLYILAVVIPIGFQAGPLVMTTLRVLLLVLTVPLGIRLVTGRLGGIFLTDVLFMLHILWVIVALAMNNPSQVVQQAGSVGVEFIGGYLVGRAYIRTAGAFAAVCRMLALVVCCLLPFALIDALTSQSIIVELLRNAGVAAVGVVNAGERMGLHRTQASFAHPIHYGVFCSIAFSLTFVAMAGTLGTARRYVTSALIAFAGFLALSSGALLAIALQVALIAWSSIFARVNARWWLLVGLFVLAYIAIDLSSNRAPLQVFMSYATFSAHNAYWRSIIFEWGMKNVWANPIFGIGLNDWVRPWYMHSGSMDNFWLVMAVRYGIPGFLLLALGYVLAVARIMRRDFRGNQTLTLFRRAWIFTFLGLSFALCTVHIWTNIYSFVFFMFGAGMWMIRVPNDAGTTQPDAPSDGPPEPRPRPASTYTRFPGVPRGGALQPTLRTR